MATFDSPIGKREIRNSQFKTFDVGEPETEDLSDEELRKLQQRAHQQKIDKSQEGERLSPSAKQRN